MSEVQGGDVLLEMGWSFLFCIIGPPWMVLGQPAIDSRFSTLCLVGVVPVFAFDMLQHIYCILFGPIDPHLCIARYLMWNYDSYKENQTK